MIPPLFIYLGIGRVRLPLPLMVLWPLLIALLAAAVVALPLMPLRGTTAAQRRKAPFLFWRILAALRGLSVQVRPARGHTVILRCW